MNFLTTPSVRAPKESFTLFALQLAVLKKAATGLGTFGFIWATVVLLARKKTNWWLSLHESQKKKKKLLSFG